MPSGHHQRGTLFELAKLFLCSDNLLHILFHFRNINMFKLIADIKQFHDIRKCTDIRLDFFLLSIITVDIYTHHHK